MFSPGNSVRVYVAPGASKMRTLINGLSILVAERLDPSSSRHQAYFRIYSNRLRLDGDARFCLHLREGDG